VAADGRVFVTTNAGLIAAFDIDDGSAIWAYQYANESPESRRNYSSAVPTKPPNPLLIINGALIALPPDCDSVLALSCHDGKPLWRARRRDQSTLSLMDAGRLVLAGPGLMVLSAADGSTAWRYRSNAGISGRPAVSSTTILAGADGKVIRARLGTDGKFKVRRIRLTDRSAVLGNLVSLPGALVAGGVGAVSVYMSYENAYRELTKRMRAAEAAERAALGLDRAALSMSAGKLDDAFADLQAVRAHVESTDDQALRDRTGAAFSELYIRKGDLAAAEPQVDADGQPAADEQMGRWYAKAAAEAVTDARKAEMLIRFIRRHSKFGRPVEAVRCAVRLVEQYGSVKCRDAPIAPKDRAAIRMLPISTGRRIGLRYIKQLIDEHGRQVYAEFDAAAKTEMDEALAEGDVARLLAMSRNHPHSQWADRALVAAAELTYLRAVRSDPVDVDGLRQAAQALLRLQDYPDSPVALSGKAGEALIHLHLNPVVAAMVHRRALADVDPATKVRFGDFDGAVGELVQLLASGAPPRAAAQAQGGGGGGL